MTWEEACRILGVPASATEADIRAQWFYKANLLHPDKTANLPDKLREKANRDFQEAKSAYEFLQDTKHNPFTSPPKLEIEIKHLRFKDLEPGAQKSTSIEIKSVGGPYTKFWIDDAPTTWLRVTDIKSITDEPLPVNVTLEATGLPQPGQKAQCSIKVRLENERTKLKDEITILVEIETKNFSNNIEHTFKKCPRDQTYLLFDSSLALWKCPNCKGIFSEYDLNRNAAPPNQSSRATHGGATSTTPPRMRKKPTPKKSGCSSPGCIIIILIIIGFIIWAVVSNSQNKNTNSSSTDSYTQPPVVISNLVLLTTINLTTSTIPTVGTTVGFATLPITPIAITDHTAAQLASYKGLCLMCHGNGSSDAFPMPPSWNGYLNGSTANTQTYVVVPGSVADHTGRTTDECTQAGCHAAPMTTTLPIISTTGSTLITKTTSIPPVSSIDTNGFNIYTGSPLPYFLGGRTINLSNNTAASDPTFAQMVTFITNDQTDKKDWVTGTYEGKDFATEVHDNAEKAGIRCAFVFLTYADGSVGYYDAFNTTDKGLYFIDCSGLTGVNP